MSRFQVLAASFLELSLGRAGKRNVTHPAARAELHKAAASLTGSQVRQVCRHRVLKRDLQSAADDHPTPLSNRHQVDWVVDFIWHSWKKAGFLPKRAHHRLKPLLVNNELN